MLEDGIEILHVNTSSFSQILKWIKKETNIKIVTHVREWIHHSGIGKIQRYIIDEISQHSDWIITISDVEAEVFKDQSNVSVIANPFDFTKLEGLSTTYRSDQGLAEEMVLVAMMGRFVPAKGHLLFLKTLKQLVDQQADLPPFQFVLIGVARKEPLWKRLARKVLGKEDHRIAVYRYIQQHNLADFVHLVPFTSNVYPVIMAMDVVVRPSLTRDPWGRDIIESMALSKPIVATGNSGFFVEDGKTGYLVPIDQPEQMAQRIKELMNDPDKRARMGQAGHERILEKSALPTHVKQVQAVYNRLME